VPRCAKIDVGRQTNNHNQQPIDSQRQRQFPKDILLPSPLHRAHASAAPHKRLTLVVRAVLIPIIILLHQSLVQRRVGRGDLVVKQPWQNEADARAPSAADVGKHLLKRGNAHGDDVSQDDDDGCDGGETHVAHFIVSRLGGVLDDRASGRRGVVCVV